MKKFLLTLTAIFICTVAHAKTINWYIGDTVYQTTTCESGSSITPPTPPVKNGYTFVGWKAYTPIEYLESTGTQWIDTGLVYNQSLAQHIFSMNMKYTFPKKVSDIYGRNNNLSLAVTGVYPDIMCLVPYYYGGDFTFVQHGSSDQSDGRLLYVSPTNSLLNVTIDPTNMTYKVSTDTTIKNGNMLSIRYSDKSIYLFKANGNSAANFPFRIYASSFESDGVKVRDFIPVLDRNNVPCMYDKVEGKFYYNAGTGQFIAGPVIGGGGE